MTRDGQKGRVAATLADRDTHNAAPPKRSAGEGPKFTAALTVAGEPSATQVGVEVRSGLNLRPFLPALPANQVQEGGYRVTRIPRPRQEGSA
jgi:hypothetical protein